jgi:hypothetical protein
MSVAAPRRRFSRMAAVLATGLVVTGLLSGCGGGGGSGADEDPRAVPVTPQGSPTPVDVCALLTPADTARSVGRALRPVSEAYGAAKVATLQCELGRRFARPVLSVALGIGPVSEQVFDEAYGEVAGGDPESVRRLGQAAIVRTEAGQTVVHVLVHGSVLTVSATIDATHAVRRAALLDLARIALAKLPSNPLLASTASGRRCPSVATEAVAAAVGAEPALSSEFRGGNGSIVCSWTSLPGAAVVTVLTSPSRVAAYTRLAATRSYRAVDLTAPRPGVRAMSRVDRAGDLLILTGHAVILLSVMPTAGWSDRGIGTTPGEARLAAAVLTALT